MPTPALTLNRYFAKLKDPRRNCRKRHLLLDIIVIAICGIICGCDTFPEIEVFGRGRREWLSRFLNLPQGIPSHDTFQRVFERLNPQVFQACLRAWVQALADVLGTPQIAIDGKTLRGSGDAARGWGPLHLVSAWATASHLSLGQVAVDAHSNEIPAIPKLLELLDLHGALVTLDAMGCQKEIAQQIIAGGGDYLLVVKDNQPTLAAAIRTRFEEALASDFAGLDADSYATQERGHGREEQRCYHILRDPVDLPDQEAWPQLRVIGMCYSERTVKGTTSVEVRLFIGSKQAGARYYGKALRNHWRIENSLHWQLDVTFHEDQSRLRQRNLADNVGALRRLALTLLKQHPSKRSIACKRLAAAVNTEFLEEVLRGTGNAGNL